MKPFAAALVVCLASAPAAAQEAKDGVFTHKEHQIQVTVPKDWTARVKDFQWNWVGALAEFGSPDDSIGAVLAYEAAAMKVERYADALEKNTQAVKGMKSYKKVKDEKLEGRKTGSWLLREYEMDFNDNDYRRVVVFVNKGKHNFHFTQWCFETQFDDLKGVMYKNLETLAYGDLPEAKPADPKPAAGGAAWTHAETGVSLAVPEGFDRRERDFQLGDANAVLEFQKGSDAYGTLGIIAFEGDVKAWADASIQAFEKSMENVKLLDARAAGEWERRDFRADTNGVAVRFAMLFHAAAAKRKGIYLYVWCAEKDWDAHKAVFERVLESAKAGGEAKPADPKPAEPKPAAGDATAVAEDAWKGCGVDSTVTYRMVAAGNEVQMTYVLLEHKDGESYTMRTDMVTGGTKIPGQPMKFVVKKIEPAGKPPEGQEPPQIEQGEETVKVAKGEFKCTWTKTTTKQGWSKAWSCGDVPFRLVKSESEFSGAKTTMELVDFEKK